MRHLSRVLLSALALAGCRDLSSFSTGGDRYEGSVVQAAFVLAGIDAGTDGGPRLCLSLDTDRLQDAPGKISTSDGRFSGSPLRPIPQIWHDPLSTLDFGDGRAKNLVYVATASTPFADGSGSDVFAIVSLMESGSVEVRLLRSDNVFAVFVLSRQKGACSF